MQSPLCKLIPPPPHFFRQVQSPCAYCCTYHTVTSSVPIVPPMTTHSSPPLPPKPSSELACVPPSGVPAVSGQAAVMANCPVSHGLVVWVPPTSLNVGFVPPVATARNPQGYGILFATAETISVGFALLVMCCDAGNAFASM